MSPDPKREASAAPLPASPRPADGGARQSVVTDMATTIAQAYDDEIIYVDGDGFLDWDDERFAELASRMNPTASYWRD